MNELKEVHYGEIEKVKESIDYFDDYRQVEAIYNYCFEILNESGIYEVKEKTNK